MRVLLVAPRSNLLAIDEEIQDVLRSGLEITPLVGSVTVADMVRDMRDGDYDVLWLATHGDADGVELSNGERFSAAELVAHVRGRFSLVILNTCESLGIAQMLQEEAGVGVICTLLKVPDTLAYRTASRLAAALAESASIADAYLASKPGRNREYLYLPALRPSGDSIDVVMAELRQLRDELARSRFWERRLLVAALALHPATWFIMWLMWRL